MARSGGTKHDSLSSSFAILPSDPSVVCTSAATASLVDPALPFLRHLHDERDERLPRHAAALDDGAPGQDLALEARPPRQGLEAHERQARVLNRALEIPQELRALRGRQRVELIDDGETPLGEHRGRGGLGGYRLGRRVPAREADEVERLAPRRDEAALEQPDPEARQERLAAVEEQNRRDRPARDESSGIRRRSWERCGGSRYQPWTVFESRSCASLSNAAVRASSSVVGVPSSPDTA